MGCIVRAGIGAGHAPLFSEDFVAARCAAVRAAFSDDGALAERLNLALHSYLRTPKTSDNSSDADAAMVGLFSRLHGLPGHPVNIEEHIPSGGSALGALPRLRRALPGASAQGLRKLVMAF